MRNFLLSIAFAFAIFLSFSSPAGAQTKKPSKESKAATAVITPDLSGIWFDDHPRPELAVGEGGAVGGTCPGVAVAVPGADASPGTPGASSRSASTWLGSGPRTRTL